MIFEISFLTNVNIFNTAWKSLTLLGVIQIRFKFQFFFLTNLIPAFNTSAFLKKTSGFQVRKKKYRKLQIEFMFSSKLKIIPALL